MNQLALLIPENAAIKKFSRPIRVLGIDLGTTNSAVAEIIWDSSEHSPINIRCLDVIQNTPEGDYSHVLVPSMVTFYEGQVIVGEGAKRLRAKASELNLKQNQNLFYECKNDIGIMRTYHMAPEGFRSAAEIGGHVLDFLHAAALEENDANVSRVVVTVPASFQAAQRHDTLLAAELANLQLTGGDLLDEPIAAFLDYLVTYRETFIKDSTEAKSLIVFDFGGGTCDVAIFRLQMPNRSRRLQISPLAVSRYHRLGGGDIDAAIVYDVLIPQLIKENNLSQFDLSFEDKKKFLEPALLGVAESLKIGLCQEIVQLQQFGKYDSSNKTQILKQQPGLFTFKVKNRTLNLQSPKLTASQLEEILKPFLDQDLLYARETEYRMSCSIFAPLQDALDRSSLTSKQVDYCLLVGGSSLIPQVVQAVGKYFPKAKLMTYSDNNQVQTAIARGAAFHALVLTLYGKPLIQPVCHDAISIRAESGLVELIPKGAELPYPSDTNYARCYSLAVPETTSFSSVDLRVEIVGGDDERKLFSQIWQIPGPVKKGDPLCLEYRFDENQVLDLRMKLANSDDYTEPFTAKIENPLTNVVNPQSRRLKIDEIEEDLRNKKYPASRVPEKLVELAENYVELGQREKAIDYLKKALQGKHGVDASILNKMGIYFGELGDYDREEKFYKEATAASPFWSTPWFNLALAQKKRKRYSEAFESLEKAFSIRREGPYLVLAAQVADACHKVSDRDKYLKEAFDSFASVATLDDWELGWILAGARLASKTELIEEIQAEQKRRKERRELVIERGVLPIITPGLQKVSE